MPVREFDNAFRLSSRGFLRFFSRNELGGIGQNLQSPQYPDKLTGRIPPTQIAGVITDSDNGHVRLFFTVLDFVSEGVSNDIALERPIELLIDDRAILDRLPDLLAGHISCQELLEQIPGRDRTRLHTLDDIRALIRERNAQDLTRIVERDQQLQKLLDLFPRTYDVRKELIVTQRMRVVSENIITGLREMIENIREQPVVAPPAGQAQLEVTTPAPRTRRPLSPTLEEAGPEEGEPVRPQVDEPSPPLTPLNRPPPLVTQDSPGSASIESAASNVTTDSSRYEDPELSSIEIPRPGRR